MNLTTRLQPNDDLTRSDEFNKYNQQWPQSHEIDTEIEFQILESGFLQLPWWSSDCEGSMLLHIFAEMDVLMLEDIFLGEVSARSLLQRL